MTRHVGDDCRAAARTLAVPITLTPKTLLGSAQESPT